MRIMRHSCCLHESANLNTITELLVVVATKRIRRTPALKIALGGVPLTEHAAATVLYAVISNAAIITITVVVFETLNLGTIDQITIGIPCIIIPGTHEGITGSTVCLDRFTIDAGLVFEGNPVEPIKNPVLVVNSTAVASACSVRRASCNASTGILTELVVVVASITALDQITWGDLFR